MTNIPHIIEAALLLLLAYIIGCLIGYFLRAKLFNSGDAPAAAPAASVTAAQPSASPKPAAKAASKPKPTAKKPARASKSKGSATPSAPKKLDAPRDGQKDNLKMIKGIGPKIEGQLNALGVYHFDQIAEWDRGTVAWVDSHLSFKGRIDRERWVSQAQDLAKS
jgi:predicted flap endonuclease-1-like 5' DNA nuclease